MNDLKKWNDEERIRQVRRFFSTITDKYDFMNHFMSAGQDIHWRRFTSRRIPKDSKRILDIACGTGDLSFTLGRKFPGAEVIGLDFVPEMIEVATQKSQRKKAKNVRFLEGDALALPFEDGIFDACTIAFGFRNIPDKDRALAEMKRVLRPGGKVMVLEMTLPEKALMRPFYAWYLRRVIPAMGRIFSPDPEAYSYLSASIEDFFQPEELSEFFRNAGLADLKATALSMGITYLHEGTKPAEEDNA